MRDRIEGARLNLPVNRYEAVMSRVEEFMRAKYENLRRVHRFIALDDRGFIARFIARNPDFVTRLGVGSYFYAVSDIDVINRLFALGLLPEPERQRHVAAVRDAAVTTPDAGFISKKTVGFLTNSEIEDTLQDVQWKLLFDLDTCIDNWRDNYNQGEEPDEYFRHLIMALRDYKGAFSSDSTAIGWIDAGLAKIKKTADELRSEATPTRDDELYLGGDRRNWPPFSMTLMSNDWPISGCPTPAGPHRDREVEAASIVAIPCACSDDLLDGYNSGHTSANRASDGSFVWRRPE